MHTQPLPQARFDLQSDYAPAGDQPQAIATLIQALQTPEPKGHPENKRVTLLGVTGSGKTFTMAHTIASLQRPTLILAHNKTLAAQLYNEMQGFFPHNKVAYFISYYDYYRPEAYIPRTDTFIEKTAQVNDEIDRLRHLATRALFERRDVIIVASVSCIYGLGIPENYLQASVIFELNDEINREELLSQLVRMAYVRVENPLLERTHFRVRGDVIDIFPADEERILRLTFWDTTLESLCFLEAHSGKVLESMQQYMLVPAVHFVTPEEEQARVVEDIKQELEQRLKELHSEGLELEARRLETRVLRDLEMMKELGYCNGIENYSRIIEGRLPGTPPKTLLDYFPDDFLLMIDESHITVSQVRGMYHGDVSRKETLVKYGFRLPCAKDNRPLNFDEFWHRVGDTVFISATPNAFELEQSSTVAEQVIRPTGLLDPLIEIHPTEGQIDTLMQAIQATLATQARVLITTLTKRMAEDLSAYLQEMGIKVQYLHSDVKPLERIEIIRDLRLGRFEVLVGVNLLREGLDLPEVALVAIMDADKEGFLRSSASLIQTIGRAARNAAGKVLLFADSITDSMHTAIDETKRRRALQEAFNTRHGITPKTILKPLSNGLLEMLSESSQTGNSSLDKPSTKTQKAPSPQVLIQTLVKEAQASGNPTLIQETREQLEQAMKEAAKNLEFEQAAMLRDAWQALG
ncbi:MAG: excinuclease ABC subunit UvrB [Vampirovibrionales bacterium]